MGKTIYDPQLRKSREWGPLYHRWRDLKVKYRLCEEWKNAENFYHWAMESGYEIMFRLVILDESKPLSPENCRWETKEAKIHWSAQELEFAKRWDNTVNFIREKCGLPPLSCGEKPPEVRNDAQMEWNGVEA